MKVWVVIALVIACQAQIICGVNVTASLQQAARWLVEQRGDDFTWGEFTPRAVVALALADHDYPLSNEEWQMMRKQINILLSLELAKPSGIASLGLTRTALFINALLATCQDPSRFHGLDLLSDLRVRLSAARNATLPAAYLSLCLAGRGLGRQDMTNLANMVNSHADRPDLRAIDILAMACLVEKDKSMESAAKSYFDYFHKWFPSVTGVVDVYTRALGFQALNANGRALDPSPLVRHQAKSGSFGSLLATYYAIPALQGNSLLALKDRRCHFKTDRVSEDKMLLSSAVPKVFYSLWIGEGDERDTHALTVPLDGANVTFFDLMNIAKQRNPVFKFSWEESAVGKKVYSVAGRPNDVEREIYWTLYVTKGAPNGKVPKPANLVNQGVDRVVPTAGDHFIFWFRRKPQ